MITVYCGATADPLCVAPLRACPRKGDPYSNVEAPGDLWMIGPQVAPHWWVITNNLN